jgi:hypothetical protein
LPYARRHGDPVIRPSVARHDRTTIAAGEVPTDGVILGRVEMPVTPYHRAEDPRRQPPQQVLDLGVRHGGDQISSSARDSMIGRTSANTFATTKSGAGQFPNPAAISVARSKLSHSTIQ